MKITVLGSSGAWPTESEPSSGFLVEHEGFRLVLDLGYATFPRLLSHIRPDEVDAVLVSHGHPDHCADLNPLLRSRALDDDPPTALPVYSLPGAREAVLALDNSRMLENSIALHEFKAGDRFTVGPLEVETRLLPHFVPNAGFRLSSGNSVLSYTGDTGPSSEVVSLARNADVLIADSTFVDRVPAADAEHLSSAVQAADQARQAQVAHLVLTHLWPGTDPSEAQRSAEQLFSGRIDVARSGLVIELE